jgi:mono/diheme cytochrome c family protein
MLPLLLLGAALGAARQQHAPAHAPRDAAQLFQERCLTCHVPPDPRFAVDRAWLEQVRDTA